MGVSKVTATILYENGQSDSWMEIEVSGFSVPGLRFINFIHGLCLGGTLLLFASDLYRDTRIA